MKFNSTTKALLMGFLVGVIFVSTLGIALPSNELAPFGVAVPSGSLVVVKDRMGWAWVLDPTTATVRGISRATANEQTSLQLP